MARNAATSPGHFLPPSADEGGGGGKELIRKLVNLQKIDPKTGDGYWVNEAGRWWEADTVLVTSYSLLALEIALQ